MLFATGRSHYDAINAGLPALLASIKVVPYIDDMPSILPDIGLLISRAGATTLAEITALGILQFIPSPNVTHHHQYLNAQSLTKRRGINHYRTRIESDFSSAGCDLDGR